MSLDKFTPNFDFASLYPTVMKVYNNDYFKMIERRKKLDKIINRMNNV